MKNLFTYIAVIAMTLVSTNAMAANDGELKTDMFDFDDLLVLSAPITIPGMATESGIDGVWSHHDNYLGVTIVITIENGKYTLDMGHYGSIKGTVKQLSADTYMLIADEGNACDTVTLTTDGKLKLGTEKFDRIG